MDYFIIKYMCLDSYNVWMHLQTFYQKGRLTLGFYMFIIQYYYYYCIHMNLKEWQPILMSGKPVFMQADYSNVKQIINVDSEF